VADNASSRALRRGTKAAISIEGPTAGSVSCSRRMVESVASGSGRGVLGHPGLSLAMLANLLAEREAADSRPARS
jgi:2-keto-4-pentenoate hydratase